MKQSFKYEFEYAGMNVDIGLGGIHACNKAGVYEPEEDEVILDVDFKSFYPNLAIKNGFFPEHISVKSGYPPPAGGTSNDSSAKNNVFLDVYSRLYQQRKEIPKSDPRNYVIKIILNSTYGLSKEINSYLYDPKFTYSIK